MDDTGNCTEAARAYFGLVVASLLLPFLVFLGGSWLAWNSTLRDAHAELDRTVSLSVEHATRVLETHQLIAARVDDLLRGMDDAAVTAQEPALRDEIRAMIQRFPQVINVVVIDSQGRVLVSASGHPGDGSASAYVTALHDPHTTFYIDTSPAGRSGGPPVISVGYRRGDASGGFQGVTLISVSSGYFEALDRALFNGSGAYTADLLRSDGTILARVPPTADRGSVPSRDGLLLQAIKHDPRGSTIRANAWLDGRDWLVDYRKLDDYPVYVSVGRSWDSIVGEWRALMASYLIFGIPATLGLCALSLLAARRARRESATLAELRAEVRRREVAEHALRQSQKMEAIGRLTGGFAHDFNNHLTVVGSNIELLKRRLPANSGALTRLADSAMNGVQRAATLTHRLLAFSRQQPLDPEPSDMGRLVLGMSDLLRRTLGEDIIVETVLGTGLWLTRVDANQVENALLNLAVNARDAMPQGGKLTIATANVHLNDAYVARHSDATVGDHVRISVTDTGTGMPADIIAKVFEPFFTTKPLGQGTGLGLSMVYGFVRQSGGNVAISSEPGRGSTVTLHLPRYLRDDAAVAASAPRNDVLPADSTGETVLVVEDDDAVRQSAAAALQDMGYQVLEAPDAMEAIRLIADRGGIDLLFTDVGLPGGVDGRALADAARSASPKIRILFTTGYSEHRLKCATSPDHGIHFLAKPFTLHDLGMKVREVLDAPVPGLPVTVGSDTA